MYQAIFGHVAVFIVIMKYLWMPQLEPELSHSHVAQTYLLMDILRLVYFLFVLQYLLYLLNLLLAALAVVSTVYDPAVACGLVKGLSAMAVVLTEMVIEMHWRWHELRHISNQDGCIGSVNLLALPTNLDQCVTVNLVKTCVIRL